MTRAKSQEPTPDLLNDVTPAPPVKTGVRGGYQAPPGASKPKLPTTGSGVRSPRSEVVVHQPSVPKTLLQVVTEAAGDKNVDVPKLKELLAMAREEQDRLAVKAFNESMLAAQTAMPRIVKDAFNPHAKARYPKLENISQAVDPVARSHGFVLSYGMSDSPVDDHYRIICDVSHNAGHTRRYFADIGSATAGAKGGGVMSPAQGSGASIAYGRRYLKCMIFDLVILGEDIDAAGQSVGPLTDKEIKELRAAMDAKGITVEQFQTAFLCLPENLPKRRLQEVHDRISQAVARKKKAAESEEVA